MSGNERETRQGRSNSHQLISFNSGRSTSSDRWTLPWHPGTSHHSVRLTRTSPRLVAADLLPLNQQTTRPSLAVAYSPRCDAPSLLPQRQTRPTLPFDPPDPSNVVPLPSRSFHRLLLPDRTNPASAGAHQLCNLADETVPYSLLCSEARYGLGLEPGRGRSRCATGSGE